MLTISKIRTRRLEVHLNPMTIGDAIKLCGMPETMPEAGTSALLRCIVEKNESPRPGTVTDPALWTVQERALCVAHYLSHTAQDGDPNIQIGDNGRLTDYLLDGVDFAEQQADLGTLEGDHWYMQPVLGMFAEAVERKIISGQLSNDRAGWWFGIMACVLWCEQLGRIDASTITESELDDLIDARVSVLRQFSEKDFFELLGRFLMGLEQMQHLFRLSFSNQGIVWMPKKVDGKEVAGLSPATFPCSSAISISTKEVFGNA